MVCDVQRSLTPYTCIPHVGNRATKKNLKLPKTHFSTSDRLVDLVPVGWVPKLHFPGMAASEYQKKYFVAQVEGGDFGR